MGKVPELPPGTGPRAFDRPWWAARPPPSARPAITTAAATTAAPAATDCVCRARHRSLGGSSGLGKPWCPNVAACCATLARWATASGVSLLASLSTCARSPCGMAAIGSAASGARPSSSAGASSRRLRSVHAGHRSMCRLIRLRIRTFSCPSQSSSSALERGAVGAARTGDEQRAQGNLQLVTGAGEQRVRVVAGNPEYGRDFGDV